MEGVWSRHRLLRIASTAAKIITMTTTTTAMITVLLVVVVDVLVVVGGVVTWPTVISTLLDVYGGSACAVTTVFLVNGSILPGK